MFLGEELHYDQYFRGGGGFPMMMAHHNLFDNFGSAQVFLDTFG